MRLTWNLFLTVFSVVALVACAPQSSNKKTKVSTQRTARGYSDAQYFNQRSAPISGQASAVSGQTWAAILIDPSNQYVSTDALFNQNIHDFVETIMDPSQLGYVSGQPNAATGVRFWGLVQTSNIINPNGQNNVQVIAANSEIRMTIWDEYAGKVDSSGELVPEVAIDMRGSASGYISGSTAVVRFQDNYGWVEFYGTVSGGYFQGQVFFDNTGGAANYLGKFAVPVCSFFRCN